MKNPKTKGSLLVARRIGELVPAETAGRGRKIIRSSDNFPTPQRLCEFRKLAEIPLPKRMKPFLRLKGFWMGNWRNIKRGKTCLIKISDNYLIRKQFGVIQKARVLAVIQF